MLSMKKTMISRLTSRAEAHQIPVRFEKEAERIKNAWLELDRHPVLKAVVLERSVFFGSPTDLPIPWRHRTTYDQCRHQPRMSRPTSLQTPLSVSRSALSLTKSSISLGELRLLGCFNPYKGRALKSISRKTSGWQVQIACIPVVRRRVSLSTRASRMPAFFETNNVNLPQYA